MHDETLALTVDGHPAELRWHTDLTDAGRARMLAASMGLHPRLSKRDGKRPSGLAGLNAEIMSLVSRGVEREHADISLRLPFWSLVFDGFFAASKLELGLYANNHYRRILVDDMDTLLAACRGKTLRGSIYVDETYEHTLVLEVQTAGGAPADWYRLHFRQVRAEEAR